MKFGIAVVLAVYFGTYQFGAVVYAAVDYGHSPENVVAVDPSTFTCNERSPITNVPPVFSSTTPPVAMIHIFCGEIKEKSTGRKKAEGFHSRPQNKNPPCAKATGRVEHYSNNTAYYATNESVYDAEALKWIPRTNQKKYYYFPSAWSIQVTVENLIRIYQQCNATKSPTNEVCIKNYTYEGGTPFDVTLFLSTDKQNIVSAFPGPCGSCKQRCAYAHDF